MAEEDDGTAAFFERLLESMGIKPEEAVKHYAAAFVDAGAALADFEEASLEELASDYGFKRLHVKKVEMYRSAKSAGGGGARLSVGGSDGGASPRESASPSDALTPRGMRWSVPAAVRLRAARRRD